jgi:hypothetical protein
VSRLPGGWGRPDARSFATYDRVVAEQLEVGGAQRQRAKERRRRVEARWRYLRWLPVPAAVVTVVLAVTGAVLAHKTTDPASGGCVAADHETLGGNLLVWAFLVFAPFTALTAVVTLAKGPRLARLVALAAVVAVAVLFYAFLLNVQDYYCSK